MYTLIFWFSFFTTVFCVVTAEIPTVSPTTLSSTSLTSIPKNTSIVSSPSASRDSNPSGNCDLNTIFYNGACWFRTRYDHINWNSAEQYCKDNGGHLASIHSENDIHFINSTFVPYSYNAYKWIGLTTKDVSTDIWEWSDGTAVDYLPWIDQQSSTIPSECASLHYNKSLYMYDGFSHSCWGLKIGICKKEANTD